MQEVHRILRPGGRLVLDTDNDAFLFHKKGFRRLNDWLERDTPQRAAHFSPSSAYCVLLWSYALPPRVAL